MEKIGAKTNVKNAALQIGQRARRKANRAAGKGGFGNAPRYQKGASAAMQQRELETPEDRRRKTRTTR